jgi:hypothetical protein
MDNFKTLIDNVKKYIIEIKEINSIKNTIQKAKLFNNFYKYYWKFMSYLNNLIQQTRIKILRKSEPKNTDRIKQIKELQKFYTDEKIKIDNILLGLEDSNSILPIIKQKNKNNPIPKWKNLANKIQIQTENKNSKYITNLSSEDINNLSSHLEFFYNSITQAENPSVDFFSQFYDLYNKLMKELNRIKISKSKNVVDKIKKGLIAKKINIDSMYNSLFNSRLKNKNKNYSNVITPKNLVLNNTNKIVLPHPPLSTSDKFSKNPIAKKNIDRLKELELKHKIFELSPNELTELKTLKISENKRFYNNISAIVGNLSLTKNTGAGIAGIGQ